MLFHVNDNYGIFKSRLKRRDVNDLKRIVLILLIASSVILGLNTKFEDVGTAHRISVIEDKILLMEFSSETCGYCVKFMKEVFPDETVQKLLRSAYIFVEILPNDKKTTFLEKEYTNSQLFGAFGIRGTPTFIFWKGDKGITKLPGFVPSETFVKVLMYILRYMEENIQESFEEYMKKKDTFFGHPKIVTVSKEEGDFILKNDPNSTYVNKFPENLDVFKVYITNDKELANSLKERGVYRVLLIQEE